MFSLNNTFDRNTSCQTCWANLPFAFKVFFLSSCFLSLAQLIFGLNYYFFSYPLFTILKIEIYRPFLSMYLSIGINGILNCLIMFLWFLDLWPNMEKKYSSIFVLLNVILHNLLVQTFFTIIVFTYGLITGLRQIQTIFSGGWGVILLIYLFKQSSKNPNENIRFCCFPCLIPRKYIPWIMFAFGILFSNGSGDILAYLCAAFIGYTEAFYLKTNMIRLPLSFYAKIDYWMPLSIKNRSDYVEVSQVRQSLREVTYSCFKTQSNVEVLGGGISLGSNFPQNPVNLRQINIKRFQNFEVIERAQAQELPKSNNRQNLFDEDLYDEDNNKKSNDSQDNIGRLDDTKLSQNGLIKGNNFGRKDQN